MNNYERFKSMTLYEMAKQLTELQCVECGQNIDDNWQNCKQTDCWCHSNNNYKDYVHWLQTEFKV